MKWVEDSKILKTTEKAFLWGIQIFWTANLQATRFRSCYVAYAVELEFQHIKTKTVGGMYLPSYLSIFSRSLEICALTRVILKPFKLNSHHQAHLITGTFIVPAKLQNVCPLIECSNQFRREKDRVILHTFKCDIWSFNNCGNLNWIMKKILYLFRIVAVFQYSLDVIHTEKTGRKSKGSSSRGGGEVRSALIPVRCFQATTCWNYIICHITDPFHRSRFARA